ncbi:ATP-binding cassette sub-family A member 10 [Tenrec ecaudatus]|uniref:ATP-binding cassette sub-family A member 10 n=1 Tax=Tenrec ecaudatus TaxID=94439 RepID=UPI003F592DF1
MDKVALAPFMKGRRLIEAPDERAMDKFYDNYTDIIGIVFADIFSYQLKLHWGYRIPHMMEHSEYSEHCWRWRDHVSCSLEIYWEKGIVVFQSAINAAIIEITTNHSVMEKLLSVTGINMRTLPFITKSKAINELIMFTSIMSFSPLVYFASLNIMKETKRIKKLMIMMGLRESAFWLSWGLMYAGFILIISTIWALVLTSFQFIVLTGFMVTFTLFALYGLSLIASVFLFGVLIKKPVLTGLTTFLFTIFWGCLGFTVLHRKLPSALEWMLGLFSPFAFTAGLSKITHLDYYLIGVNFPDHTGESHVMITTFFTLASDALLYLILALYLERVLPDENGHRHPPLFFLKSSFGSHHQNTHHEVFEDEINPEHISDDSFEPVPPEFNGKEAIRIRNVKKEYHGKPGKIQALRGICFDIYEGQVTAILGHSGAGKSTLLNILSGLSVSTEGSVTIYNTKLSQSTNMEDIRKNLGFCPQFNIQFDFLTVRENLRLFAKIKGIQPKEVEQEVKRIIMELDIQNIQNVFAKELSGGQKRKLTFGIALLGDPQVLLLDEPTAGLDPLSRHRIWTLVKERKADRVILFSTQFMDEADILADRKAFLSNGQLKCAGSSLFLKRKWGIGYHLSLHRNETCDPQRITSLIKQHIPEAKLRAESEEKLVYTLPLGNTDKFPDLYNDLDKCSGQDIMSYGVSMTTLTEVFLNLEGISTIAEPDFGIWKQETIDVARDPENASEVQQGLCSFPEMQKAVSDGALWRRQICAVAKLHFLKLRHSRKVLLSLLLLFCMGFIPIILENIVHKIYEPNKFWEYLPSKYFLSLEQLPRAPLTSLLIINNTGSNIEDLVSSIKHQNITLEVDDFRNRNGSDDPSYNGAIIVSGDERDYRFSVACHTKRLNCFPVLMGIVSNALLGIFNSTGHIQTKGRSFIQDDLLIGIGLLNWSILLVFFANGMSPNIGMSSISDYKKKTQFLLRISGLYPSAYWCGRALVDIPLYYVILLSAFLIQDFMISDFIILSKCMIVTVVCLFGCTASIILFTYVISFMLHKGRENTGLWSLGFFIISIITFFIMIYDAFRLTTIILCMIFMPLSILLGFIVCLILIYTHHEDQSNANNEAVKIMVATILISCLQSLLFLFILRCLEMKYGSDVRRKDPVFRISPRNRETRPNPEAPEEEDEDVQAERVNTANALTSPSVDEKPVIIASCLRKEYKKKKSCFSTRTTKLAIRNVSFCVKKGEILGLLGHNGAGKSTSIKVIMGDTKPTAGVVVLQGKPPSARPREDSIGFLGYCPQENTLWPSLTMQDHLELFAAVKGQDKEEAALGISRLVNMFKLQDQLKVPVKALSEGVKRKLCFMLSMLGGPAVMLLDEPSTGMDPEGQQQMWQAIRSTVRNTERGALLSTHYMAEAEAVCDRVAIMVSGRLRCIGSIQHLKSKFGKDYLLEIKMKEPTQAKCLHKEILKLFPQAARQDRYSSLMAYKLPVDGVYPLSQAFFRLEAVKQTFDLEEYSLSQATLEQVFLELSKEQELGNFDDEIDTSVKWKLLPQEEP